MVHDGQFPRLRLLILLDHIRDLFQHIVTTVVVAGVTIAAQIEKNGRFFAGKVYIGAPQAKEHPMVARQSKDKRNKRHVVSIKPALCEISPREGGIV